MRSTNAVPCRCRIVQLLSEITYKNWRLRVVQDPEFYIQWVFNAPCSVTGESQEWTTRKWRLSDFMTDGEVVQTAFAAALQAEEHECRENFKYAGLAPFNPHISLPALMLAAASIEGRT